MPTLLNRVSTPKNSCLMGGAVFLAGSIILTGWMIGLPKLTTLGLGSGTVSIGAALGFMLTGIALMLRQVVLSPRSLMLQRLCGGLIVTITAVGVVKTVVESQVTAQSGFFSRAILMNPAGIVGLLIMGSIFLMSARKQSPRVQKAIRIGTVVIALIGGAILLGSFINTDYLYVTGTAKPVAQSGAVLFVLIAFALWSGWLNAERNQAGDGADTHQIYRTIDILVTVIVATVSLVAFSLSQGRTEQIMLDQLSITGKDKRNYFETVLQARLDKARLISSRPALVNFVREDSQAGGKDPSKHAPLLQSATTLLQQGFSAISYTDDQGTVLAAAGQSVTEPEQRLHLWGQRDIELLWDHGYVLRTRLPLIDEAGSTGFLTSEQRLDELTRMHQDALREGDTGDMVVCALVNQKQDCFPFRWRSHAGQYNAYLDGKPLPLTRAASGEIATDVTTDFRRQRVMAALGPIGKTGLGMAVKRDMIELYAPVRRQFFTALPFLAVLIFGSVWAMRALVHPLVKALDASRLTMRSMALTDSLTGLANRALFMDRLGQTMARARRTSNLMAVMYLDLDHFKTINDTLGHQTGDAVLQWTARQLESSVRATDTVARLGGDEFTIILENLSGREDAERIARAILQFENSNPVPLSHNVLKQISTSIGIAFYQGEDMTAEAFLNQADRALYRCKQEGRAGYRMAVDDNDNNDNNNNNDLPFPNLASPVA